MSKPVQHSIFNDSLRFSYLLGLAAPSTQLRKSVTCHSVCRAPPCLQNVSSITSSACLNFLGWLKFVANNIQSLNINLLAKILVT